MSCLGINKLHPVTRAVFFILLLYSASGTAQQLPLKPDSTENAVVQKLLDSGRQALLKDDTEAAARAYREVLRLQPDSTTALYQMAIYHFRKQDYVRGFDLIRRAIEISPDAPYPRLALAKALEEINKFDEAIEQYQEILKRGEPDSPPVQTAALNMNLARFRLAARARDRERILEIGTLLAQRYNRDYTVLDLVANIFIQAGYFDEARNIYFSLLKQHPDDPRVEYNLGNMWETQRDPEKALIHYERAVDKATGTPLERQARIKAEVLKGILSLRNEQHEQAQQHFRAVLEMDENNVIANMNVGGYLHARGELEAAKQAYLRALEREPENLDARYRLAIVHLDMEAPLKSVRELDYVLNRAPDSPVGQAAQRTMAGLSQRFNVAAIRKMLAAEGEILQRVRQNPNDVAALNAMGDLLMQQRRRDDALEYFERAMQADPNHGEAFFKAGLLYDDAREHEKAMQAYERALALAQTDDKARQVKRRLLVASGNVLLDRHEFDKAEDKFRQAYEMIQAEEDDKPSDLFTVLWGLAATNAQQGELEEAAKWYETLIALIPNHMGARINAAFVYEQLEEEEKASAHYNAVRLAENAPPAMKQRAENRLDYIRRQTNGFSYTTGYSLAFDDNLNSTRANKFFEYRSDFFASAVYNYKLRKGMKLSLQVSPSYAVYHRAQFDFMNFTISPSLLLDKWGYDWSLGMSRNTQSSVLRPERSSTVTDTFNMSASWRSEDEANYRASLGYRGFGSTQNPFFDAHTVNLGLNSNFAASDTIYVSYGYSLTLNNNKNTLGNDYAYTGHGLNGRIDKRLQERLTGYLSGQLTLNLYKNPDSSTNFQRRRRVFGFGFGGGLNYRLGSWVSLYANYSFTTQHSNLPVGFVFSELQSVEGRQSTSLGSFVRHSLSTGLRMNF